MSPFDPTGPYDAPDPPRLSRTDRVPTLPYGTASESPEPSPSKRASRLGGVVIGGLSLAILVVLVVLVAQFLPRGRVVTTTSATTATAVVATATLPASVVPVTATAVPTSPPASCAAVPGFADAAAAMTGSATFADVLFPTGSVGTSAGADSETQGYAHRFLSLCSPNLAPAVLGTALAALLTPRGWAQVTGASPVGADCAAFCWQSTTADGLVRFVALTDATAVGNAVTYGMELTIAPFAAGTTTLNAAHSDYSADNSTKIDLRWVSATEVDLPVAALAAPLTLPPGGFAAITFTDLRATKNFNGINLTQDELAKNSPIALQGNGGHLSKLLITQIDATGMTFQWVTYAGGF